MNSQVGLLGGKLREEEWVEGVEKGSSCDHEQIKGGVVVSKERD